MDISVLENTSDLISRQAAIDALFDKMDEPHHADFLYCDEIRDVIDALPSAQTELENKIRAIGYTGKEGKINIHGRMFAVRELPQ